MLCTRKLALRLAAPFSRRSSEGSMVEIIVYWVMAENDTRGNKRFLELAQLQSTDLTDRTEVTEKKDEAGKCMCIVEECAIQAVKRKEIPQLRYSFKKLFHCYPTALENHIATFASYRNKRQEPVLLRLLYSELETSPSRWVTICENYDLDLFSAFWQRICDPQALLDLLIRFQKALQRFQQIYLKTHAYSLSDFKVLKTTSGIEVKFDWTSAFAASRDKDGGYYRKRVLYVLAFIVGSRDNAPLTYREMRNRQEELEKHFEQWVNGTSGFLLTRATIGVLTTDSQFQKPLKAVEQKLKELTQEIPSARACDSA